MTKEINAFTEAVHKYLNSNDYRPDGLKVQLTQHSRLPRNILIREGFHEAIKTSCLSPDQWEGLTNSLIDTQEELDDKLQDLWNYIYDQGVKPPENLSEEESTFCEYSGKYLNPNAYDLESLKAFLWQESEKVDLAKFKSGIEATLRGEGIDYMVWKHLTEDEHPSNEKWIVELQKVYDFIFLDGPNPHQ